jgi:hypothetical protein
MNKLAATASIGLALLAGCCGWVAGVLGGSPIAVPAERTGTYWYDAATRTLSVQVYGAKDTLSASSLYVYSVRAERRGANEVVVTGTVTDGSRAEPMRANLGLARATLNLDEVAPGTYRFVDGYSGKVVGTIDTSVPSPPWPADEPI